MGNTEYLLGHDDPELRRLEEQAQALAPATEMILRAAGIEPGMRVIDLGSGAGDVAFAIAELVGPAGEVVGVDQSEEALDHARRRAELRRMENITFIQGDLHTVDLSGQFDAVAGRLVLLYTPDPVAVVRRYAGMLRPGGVAVAMEYDMTVAGVLPSFDLVSTAVGWVIAAFQGSGHDPILGVRIAGVFREAGLSDPKMLGIQPYFEAPSPVGGAMVSSLVRTLLPAIEGMGLATAAEVDIDTLAERIAAQQTKENATFKPPTLVGTWARV